MLLRNPFLKTFIFLIQVLLEDYLIFFKRLIWRNNLLLFFVCFWRFMSCNQKLCPSSRLKYQPIFSYFWPLLSNFAIFFKEKLTNIFQKDFDLKTLEKKFHINWEKAKKYSAKHFPLKKIFLHFEQLCLIKKFSIENSQYLDFSFFGEKILPPKKFKTLSSNCSNIEL